MRNDNSGHTSLRIKVIHTDTNANVNLIENVIHCDDYEILTEWQFEKMVKLVSCPTFGVVDISATNEHFNLGISFQHTTLTGF